jgi:hypothetical protein
LRRYSDIRVTASLFVPPESAVPSVRKQQLMKDLLSILREAPGSIRMEVSGEDLLAFSSHLINRAKEELATQVAEARKVRFLTKEQVKELCGVCDATLWHWNRKGYLKAVKIGNKIRYRTSDIQRILGERECK